MSADLDALWRELAAETQDHLEAIERLLSDRHESAWSGEEIARLFRAFHSLKGSFLAVGFANLEAVAHRAEDILSLVRDGRAALDEATAAVLLRAVDRLTDMRDRAVARRQDVEPASDIIEELARHQGAAEAAAEPAPVTDSVPLSDDAEMLALYCELLSQRGPELALALASGSETREGAAETAEQLAVGAEILGFDSLAADLQSLATLARDGADRPTMLALLDALRDQVALIEEISGTPTGSALMAAALVPYRGSDETAFDALEAALASGGDDSVAAAARDLRQNFAGLDWPRSVALLLELEEHFGRGGTEQQPLGAAWRDAGVAAVAALRSADDDLTELAVAVLRATWPDALPADAGAGPRRGSFPLEPEVLATLSMEQLDRLEAAHADGLRAYELLVELESDVEIGGDLLTWLASAVETITSRTALRQGRSGFEFLILSAEPIDWVRAQIAALDPEQHCFRDLREAGQEAPAQVPAIASAAAPAASPLIRIRSEAIDGLMTEIGEMRIGLGQLGETLRRGRLSRALHALRPFAERLDSASAVDFSNRLDELGEDLRGLADIEAAIARSHRRIWRAGLELRVVPIETLFSRLSRTVRELAQKLGKDVDLVFEGREVRIDKSMVDLLVDPLMHMVRNALDHGIEMPERRRALGKPVRAQLRLSAAEHTHGVHIVIADDGRGLDRARILGKAIEQGLVTEPEAAGLKDPEILALIFRPGFSTAETVTDVSGRGVGMDVVAAALQRLGGSCEVETEPGVGTRFTLKLPVSVALLTALIFRAGGEAMALPERQIAAVAEIDRLEIETASGAPAIRHQGAVLRLHDLGALIGFPTRPGPDTEPVRVIIAAGRSGLLGFAVEQIQHFQDLFLKELHPMLARLPAVVGASELGDGRPVLVLDAEALGQIAAERGQVPL